MCPIVILCSKIETYETRLRNLYQERLKHIQLKLYKANYLIDAIVEILYIDEDLILQYVCI